MARDLERLERLQCAMKDAGLDAVACALPANVLLLTGYFPVVGTSLAIVTRDREALVFAPEDERELAECAGNEVITFRPGSLEEITHAAQALRGPLRNALHAWKLDRAVIGYECGEFFEPSSYASMHFYGNTLLELFEDAAMRPAGEFLSRMKAVLTCIEIDRVRRACRIAEQAFEKGAKRLAPGLKETEAAEVFRGPLVTVGEGFEGVCRADGFVFCMSGPHSAEAHGAYARSRGREIEIGDLVLTHCNSHADGYWTDITRTYSVGPADDRQRKMFDAIFEARHAALDAIRPGVRACDVDRAAREALSARGFGEQFKHPAGHGVGFAAIDHNARPRLHPKSADVLECGMVFNIEPAVYIDGFGGARHCDMVAVTETGAELLTPFQCQMEAFFL